jgi:hypothetical protein
MGQPGPGQKEEGEKKRENKKNKKNKVCKLSLVSPSRHRGFPFCTKWNEIYSSILLGNATDWPTGRPVEIPRLFLPFLFLLVAVFSRVFLLLSYFSYSVF